MLGFLRRVAFLLKIRKVLADKGAEAIKCRFLPNLFRKKGRYDITCTIYKKKYNIVALSSVRRRMRYYFANENRIERYIATRMAYRPSKAGASVSNGVTWKEKRAVWLPWHELREGEFNAIVFKAFPTEISNSESRNTMLGNGDEVLSGIYVYEFLAFTELIKNCRK